MSPAKRLTTLGLTVIGLVAWGLALPAIWPSAVRAQAPSAPGAADPPDPTVLVLTSGRVVQGRIIETDDGYLVKSAIGELPFPRRDVDGVFGSLIELYAFRKQGLPDRDPDEHMKLAHWCLSYQLYAEAREQVEAVLEVSPSLTRAKAMLFQIESLSTHAAAGTPPMDQAIVRSSAEQVVAGAPGEISPSILQSLREEYRRSPTPLTPVIFDLPEPLAIKRYRDFATWVHPALQRTCAQCHNEQSPGSFQMIQARSRRDLENELLIRANLDAVLRLVEPTTPNSSKLLVSAIMPHQPNNRPVLTGPNHPTYRLLSTWVHSLQSPSSATAQATARRPSDPAAIQARVTMPASPASGGGFAVDRLNPGAARPAASPVPVVSPPGTVYPTPTQTPTPASAPAITVTPTPAGQIFPGSDSGSQRVVPDSVAFPTSPLAGQPGQLPPTFQPHGPASAAPGQPVIDPQTRTMRLPNGMEIPIVELDDPPAQDAASTPGSPAAPATSAPAVPPTIDRSALQRFMSGRR